MRFNILILVLLLSVSSVFAQKQKFEIKGTISQELHSKKLFFSRIKMYGNSNPDVTTVSVVNGKFLLKGELEEPEQAFLSFEEDAKADSGALSFLIDKGTIEITIPGKLSLGKVKGSKADEAFKAYLSKVRPETEEFNEFYKQLEQKVLKGESRDSLQLVFQNAYEIYQKAINDIRINFIKSNSDAFISLLLLPEVVENSQNYPLVDSLFNTLSADIKKKPSAKIINERFENERQFAVGAVAPTFSQADENGKQVKLTDFRGKYVLLDFWASWCAPCRQENPNLVRIFNKFKDKNFTILGISLDRPGSKAAWLKAVETDNLTWTQVSDLKFWQNEVALQYAVKSIPQSFLLDPQGKILAKNLRGEELEAALESILSGKN